MDVGHPIIGVGFVPAAGPFINIAGHVVHAIRAFTLFEASHRHGIRLLIECEPSLRRIGLQRVEGIAPWKP